MSCSPEDPSGKPEAWGGEDGTASVSIFAEGHESELKDAIGTAVAWLLGICFWLALGGGVIYGLVRFVHWAWYQ